MINNNDTFFLRITATHTIRKHGLPRRFLLLITVPLRGTWATRACLNSLSICPTSLGKNFTSTLCSQVNTPLQGTVQVGEMTLFKFSTTSYTYSIPKTHGCKEFKGLTTLPITWGSLSRRPNLRKSVLGIDADVSLTFVEKPTLTNTMQPRAMTLLDLYWRTNSSRWMFIPTKCTPSSWETKIS